MRMSFGQEMRMAQKQVLAPRMIQSMEILQLPIMALQGARWAAFAASVRAGETPAAAGFAGILRRLRPDVVHDHLDISQAVLQGDHRSVGRSSCRARRRCASCSPARRCFRKARGRGCAGPPRSSASRHRRRRLPAFREAVAAVLGQHPVRSWRL